MQRKFVEVVFAYLIQTQFVKLNRLLVIIPHLIIISSCLELYGRRDAMATIGGTCTVLQIRYMLPPLETVQMSLERTCEQEVDGHLHRHLPHMMTMKSDQLRLGSCDT